MKRFPLVSLGLAILAIPVVASFASAQQILLSVTVDPRLDFCRVPGSAGGYYNSSTLVPTTVQSIGILCTETNRPSFVIRVQSANGGELRTTPVSAYKFDYKVNGGIPSTPNAVQGGTFAAAFKPSSTIALPIYTSGTIGSQNRCKKVGGCDIEIQWQIIVPPTPMPQGVYSDTLTYTLTNN